MEEILKLVTVSEYSEFKNRVMKRFGWSFSYFSDRKNGRIKVHPLELREMYLILDELRAERAQRQNEQNEEENV